jgi:hypothetical protein
METWGGCIGMVSPHSASNRHGYTAVVLRLCGVSEVPRQLAYGSPLSAVQRVKLHGLSRLSNGQPAITATKHPPSPRPLACRSRHAAQPRGSPRARCCYTSCVLHHTPVGPELRQRDAKTLGLGLEEEHDRGTSPRHSSLSYTLTHRQTPADVDA